MEIVLTRHTSVDVPKGTCYGRTDVPLAATFEAEAASVRERLGAMGTFDAAYCSPLSRARRLAAFCGWPGAVVDERLAEIDMGEWEMVRWDDIRGEEADRWYADWLHVAPPGGESFERLYARVASFLDEVRLSGHRRVAVFAHGGTSLCAGVYAGLFGAADCFAHQSAFGGSLSISL